MPHLKVKFYGLLTDVVNEPECDVSLPDDATGRTLIQALNGKYGDQLANRLLDHQGNLMGYVRIFVNQQEVNDLEERLKIASDETTEAMIYVFSAMEGGQGNKGGIGNG